MCIDLHETAFFYMKISHTYSAAKKKKTTTFMVLLTHDHNVAYELIADVWVCVKGWNLRGNREIFCYHCSCIPFDNVCWPYDGSGM